MGTVYSERIAVSTDRAPRTRTAELGRPESARERPRARVGSGFGPRQAGYSRRHHGNFPLLVANRLGGGIVLL